MRLMGIVVAGCLVVGLWCGWVHAAEPTAREIMEKNFYVTKIKHLQNESTMTLINDKGQQRVRQSRSVSLLQPNGIDSKLMIRFLRPGDIEGTGYLQVQHYDGEDDMWIYLLAWFPMVLIAIANGVVRVGWYGKMMPEQAAHQLSTIIGIILFGIYIGIVIHLWLPESGRQAVMIGIIWLLMTVAFEFLFGHYIAGHSWQKLFEDYNLLAGRVWILVLIWITLAPYGFYVLYR